MSGHSILLKIFDDNKDKILEAGKYDKTEYDEFIINLKNAENIRINILENIKEMNSIDAKKLGEKSGISEQAMQCNIEYLKELGSLKFMGETSRFFQNIIDESLKKDTFPNVSIIRDTNLCCGCGLCVSICPVNAITYIEGTFELNEEICINCGLCFAGCPRSFFPRVIKHSNEGINTTIKHSESVNNYMEIYSAQTQDTQIKQVAQDGGIVTTLLKTAFQEGLIDATLAVGESENPHCPLPMFVRNEIELLKTSGTKYSNTPSLKILSQSKKFNKIAVVGTPCMMEALKKMSFYPLNKPFYENISFKIGLFCMESFDYNSILELLHNEFDRSPAHVKKMDIDKGRFYLYNEDGTSVDIPLKRIKKYGRLGCFFCDDLTAEQADISIGSIGSESGWSTVIIRTQKGADLFERALKRNLIDKKKINEEEKSFITLSNIAKSKQKTYKDNRRPKMIEQEPKKRIKNFDEVPFGLTEDLAFKESLRCLQCGRPLCVTGCPVNIDIPGFIKRIKLKKNFDAIHHIKTYNLLPAICGRVCPQELQCENSCLLNSLGEPISIGYLERYIADWERKNQLKECPDCKPTNNKKVAIIGSGPAGLTCAGELAMKGYDVTIFEAFHEGGGVLVYGIPEFRLPKEIVKSEIETLKMINVKIHYNSIIGKTLSIDDLREMRFKAFFIGVGAGLPIFIQVPGLNLNGVLTANEFLTRSNLMKAYRFPEYDTPIRVGKVVTVVGGGNVAMDSARTALRLGAEKVIMVYRRSEAEMPARKEEYHHGKEEGIDFRFLTDPIRFIGDENDNVKEMEVVSMELGEPDASGRRRPLPIPNSEHIIETDTIILAIGANANPILTRSIPELKLNKRGYIETDENGQTSIEGVFAGGDIVTGSATVISAMGAGKKAAGAIDNYLTNL